MGVDIAHPGVTHQKAMLWFGPRLSLSRHIREPSHRGKESAGSIGPLAVELIWSIFGHLAFSLWLRQQKFESSLSVSCTGGRLLSPAATGDWHYLFILLTFHGMSIALTLSNIFQSDWPINGILTFAFGHGSWIKGKSLITILLSVTPWMYILSQLKLLLVIHMGNKCYYYKI